MYEFIIIYYSYSILLMIIKLIYLQYNFIILITFITLNTFKDINSYTIVLLKFIINILVNAMK